MTVTTMWAPNQAAIAQQETYTFTIPSGAGNTYSASINGKTLTYIANSTDGLTAAAAATGLFTLLSASTGIAPELSEITFANPSAGVVTATASVPGVPFANVTVGGVAGQGLVMTTGNGLANGIATAHTTPNASPSDANDPQNWQRVNLSATPPALSRSLPQAGDDVVVSGSSIPMLWNLDRIAGVAINTYARWQNYEGAIGLPENNPNGYAEWRATYLKLQGPGGSVPAGGLAMTLGYNSSVGTGPTRERYDLGSSQATLNILATGAPADAYAVRFIGAHTMNTFKLLNGASLGIATGAGEKSNISASDLATGVPSPSVGAGCTLACGPNVTWTGGSSIAADGGALVFGGVPGTVFLSNGATAAFLNAPAGGIILQAQAGSSVAWSCGGIITSVLLSNGSTFNKGGEASALTITDLTLDGDTCFVNDPLNDITFTNPISVKQQVSSGPVRFMGPRTMRVI